MRKDWQRKKLGDVCAFLSRGISPKYASMGGFCVLNQKCIRNHTINYEQSRRHEINAKKVNQERFIQLGDVLINSTGTGTLGRVAQVRQEPKEPTTVDSHITIVRPKPGIFHTEFFGYMLFLIEDSIKEAGEGCGGQIELSRSVLAERFFLSYPTSINEQQRIVGILDTAFEDISIAKANTEKNLQNAKELFESHLNDTFAQRSQDGWIDRKLEDLSRINYGHTESACAEPIGPKFLRITDIQNNHVNWDTVPYCLIKASDISKYQLMEGNIVFARTGATTGKSYLITEPQNAVFASYLIRVQLKSNEVLPEFLFLFFQTKLYWDCIKTGSSGSAQGGFNATKLEKLLIPFPKLASEQLSIIAKLNNLSLNTQHLESIYKRKLTSLEELKKSILNQAFSGQL